MTTDILVPKWGLTMDEAEVVTWLKSVGDMVTEGDGVVELETDKVTGIVEAPANGTIVELVATTGDVVEPGDVLGRMETT